MARLGKNPILFPEGVEVSFGGGVFSVKGPKGELKRQIPSEIGVEIHTGERTIFFTIAKKTKESQSLLGTSYALAKSMIEGITKGFTKILELEGVGYRANLEGSDLVLALGFSHPVRFAIPAGIAMKVEKNTIEISGADKGMVGEVAAKIRAMKKPEPYKGKGIHYRGEYIRRKAGKKATAGG